LDKAVLSRKDHIRSLAESIATDFFISMLNPKYRGANFKYKKFDIGKWAVGMMGTSFVKSLNDKERSLAKEYASNIWKRWIKQAGKGLPK
jgi:hypothetical protein